MLINKLTALAFICFMPLASAQEKITEQLSNNFNGSIYWHDGNVFSCYEAIGGNIDSSLRYIEDFSGKKIISYTLTEKSMMIRFNNSKATRAFFSKMDCEESRLQLPGAIK